MQNRRKRCVYGNLAPKHSRKNCEGYRRPEVSLDMPQSKRSRAAKEIPKLSAEDVSRDERPSKRQASVYDVVAGSNITTKDRASY